MANSNSPESQALAQHALGAASTMGIAAPVGAAAEASKLGQVGLNPATVRMAKNLTPAEEAVSTIANSPANTQITRQMIDNTNNLTDAVRANPTASPEAKGMAAQRLRSLLNKAKSQGQDTSGTSQS